MQPCQRICLWSGPRNVSTAVMYAFAQRTDTRVVDEPLYAHYLSRSGAVHPGGDEVLAAQDHDGARVVADKILGTTDRPVLFVKHMAHHLYELDHGFLAHVHNVLLVRDPWEMLPSLIHQIPVPQLADTGLKVQCDLLDELSYAGRAPPVLDAQALLENPGGVLESLCQQLGLEFDPAMLSWPAGGLAEDGVWAPYWYHNIQKSQGFQPFRAKEAPFPERLRPLHETCAPYYERLSRHAIRVPTGE